MTARPQRHHTNPRKQTVNGSLIHTVVLYIAIIVALRTLQLTSRTYAFEATFLLLTPCADEECHSIDKLSKGVASASLTYFWGAVREAYIYNIYVLVLSTRN
jgi:hypothetical protein